MRASVIFVEPNVKWINKKKINVTKKRILVVIILPKVYMLILFLAIPHLNSVHISFLKINWQTYSNLEKAQLIEENIQYAWG